MPAGYGQVLHWCEDFITEVLIHKNSHFVAERIHFLAFINVTQVYVNLFHWCDRKRSFTTPAGDHILQNCNRNFEPI